MQRRQKGVLAEFIHLSRLPFQRIFTSIASDLCGVESRVGWPRLADFDFACVEDPVPFALARGVGWPRLADFAFACVENPVPFALARVEALVTGIFKNGKEMSE